MSERQNKMIKNMHVTEWGAAITHCENRDESMADFIARAIRHMLAADNAAPMFTMPDERAGLPEVGQPGRAAPAALMANPLPITSAHEFAALMSGAAALATASGVPVPRGHARSAFAALGASIRAARGLPQVSRKGSPA
jgi:hypothetical protein